VANYPALGQQLAEDVEDEIIAAGKIKQVVRNTDATTRSTTSTSFVDATITVTITPVSATSNIILIWAGQMSTPGITQYLTIQITDSSNATLSGAELVGLGVNGGQIGMPAVVFSYVAAVNTSARTYKLRFKVNAGTGSIVNAESTGQFYAIEVGA
jgi:hypothetical protein